MGFSLNNLTLFGLVLAIGIVVDDAIVVVEAVEHHIENGMSPARRHDQGHEPGLRAGDRRGIGISAVFVPCAFISGVTGQFFRQFALTIAASTIISAFNSLTLSPVLAAKFLREREGNARTTAALAYRSGWADGWHTLFLAPWVTARSWYRSVRRSSVRRRDGRVALDPGRWPGPRWLADRRAPSPSWPGSSSASIADSMRRPASTPAASACSCACSAIVIAAYCVMLVADLVGLQVDAQGICAAARHGLHDGQCAVARRGIDPADATITGCAPSRLP